MTVFSYCHSASHHQTVDNRTFKIPEGRTLTEEEKTKISVYCEENHSVSFIANKIKRSRTVVSNFIKNHEMYAKTKRPGRPPKLTTTARRRLLREASKGKSCSKELQQKLSLDVTPRQVR